MDAGDCVCGKHIKLPDDTPHDQIFTELEKWAAKHKCSKAPAEPDPVAALLRGEA